MTERADPEGDLSFRIAEIEWLGSVYSVGFAELPEDMRRVDPHQLMAALTQELARSYQVLSQDDASFRGLPSHYVEFGVPSSGNRILNRTIVAGSRLYRLSVLEPATSSDSLRRDNRKFLDSFTFSPR